MQMVVVDEVARNHRVAGLDFLDYLEALARTADLLSPPGMVELADMLRNVVGMDHAAVTASLSAHPYYTFYAAVRWRLAAGSL